MSEPSQLPARFRPLRRPTPARRALALLIGPLLWLAALVGLSVVTDRTDAVGTALIILAVSFGAGLVLSSWMRKARLREERDA